MNTLGIVMLSLFVGVFLVVLLGALGVATWSAYQARKAVLVHAGTMERILAEMTQQTAASKGAFTAIKQEMKVLLEGHQAIIAATVKAINADSLEIASVKIVNACKRMEQAVATLTTLVYDKDEIQETGLASDEAAPTGATIYGRSTNSRQDEESEVEFETSEP